MAKTEIPKNKDYFTKNVEYIYLKNTLRVLAESFSDKHLFHSVA